jgi:TRAP-type C4-dicarboxylate transport system permease small subunit
VKTEVEKLKQSKLGQILNKPLVKRILNQWELDFCVWLFLFMTVLQTIQVITRYVFRYSFVWAEELSMIMFIWMGWLSISAAVTYRKHMSITALVNTLPKKVQRYIKILSNIIFIIFCACFLGPSLGMVQSLFKGPGVTALLRIPKWVPYLIIPVMLLICIVRLLQDSYRLATEDEKVLGKSRSSMDFEAYEREYQESLAVKATSENSTVGG